MVHTRFQEGLHRFHELCKMMTTPIPVIVSIVRTGQQCEVVNVMTVARIEMKTTPIPVTVARLAMRTCLCWYFTSATEV